MVEALTEGDGELFVVNVDHISQLKACVNLKKQFQPKSAHTKKSQYFSPPLLVRHSAEGPSCHSRDPSTENQRNVFSLSWQISNLKLFSFLAQFVNLSQFCKLEQKMSHGFGLNLSPGTFLDASFCLG